MDKILLINACVRPDSRTLELAQTVLEKFEGTVEEVPLYQTSLHPLDLKGIETRDRANATQNFDDPVFDLAKQFASADCIVVAAPYWDLMFPSILKTYLENVTVCGLTFCYSPEGRPQGLCNVKKLFYITTAGGFIGQNDFGFSYMQAIAQNFFGITAVHRFAAEGLDIAGANVQDILNTAKNTIREAMV